MNTELTHAPVTRIAPSPTGLLHVGTARTALFNYLYARKYGGTFLLRIEDTDKVRSTKEFEENILEGLRTLGLEWDSMVRQSERVSRHTECLERLISDNTAYISHEPAKDGPTRSVDVVRLRNPGKDISFTDEVRGSITFNTADLGDMVIARSLTDPLYHFAVVVDDADMGVTHVIRGEDHLSNTPRQILIQEALGFSRPIYVHIPLTLAPDRSKLSKRRGAVAISDYLADGYLPEALINFFALQGWNPGSEQEIFSLEELVSAFSIEALQKSAGVFDIDRLKWFNREHLKRKGAHELTELLYAYLSAYPEVLQILQRSKRAQNDMLERVSTFREITDAIEAGDFSFYQASPVLDKTLIAWKKDSDPQRVGERLTTVRSLLAVHTDFTYDTLKELIWPYAEESGRGAVLWSLRYVLSGKERSPDPFLLLEALGKEESLARIDAGIALTDTIV